MSVFKSMDYIDMIKSAALEIQIVEFILSEWTPYWPF